MNDREYDDRRNFLESLAKKLKESADALNDVSKRMDSARNEQQEIRRELAASGCQAESEPKVDFTYLEYVEFASSAEFKHFRNLEPVTDEEIAEVDFDRLIEKLQLENNPAY